MDDDQILSRLNNIFREVFRDSSIQLTHSIAAGDIDGWDSLNHVVLVSSIEANFAIKFKLKELMSIDTVGDILRLISEKTAGASKSQAT